MLQSTLNRIRSDSNLAELLRNSGTLYVGGLVSIVIGFAQQILTANLLGLEDYGRLAVVLSSSLLVTLLLDFRTWEIGTKLISQALVHQDTEEISRVTSWLVLIELLTGTAGTVLMILLAWPIASYLLHLPELATLVAVYAISIPFRTLASGVFIVFPRVLDGFQLLALKSILYALARLGFMGGAAFLGFGLQGVILGALIAEIFHFVCLILIVFHIQHQKWPKKFTFTLARPHQFAEGRRMMGSLWTSSTLAALHYQTFIPIIALLTSPLQVGLLRSGLDVAELIERTIQPVSIVFTPRIMALYEAQDFKAFYKYIKQCFIFLLAVVLPISAGVIIFGPYLLPVLLRAEGFEDVLPILNILIVGFSVHTALQWWLRPAGIVMGQIKQQNLVMFILILLSFGLMLVYVPQYGAAAGAIIKSGFYITFSMASLLFFTLRRAHLNLRG